MVTRTDQSIKPYRPELPLRDRARQAFEAELESEAAERADALARAQRNLAGCLVVTCRQAFRVEIDPTTVGVEIGSPTSPRVQIATQAAMQSNPTLVASAIVESIRFALAMAAADAARLSGPIALGNLYAEPLCPVCGTALAGRRIVQRLADLGRVIGEVGCGSCDWEPSA